MAISEVTITGISFDVAYCFLHKFSQSIIMCLGWFMASAVDEVSAILGLSQGSDSVPDDLKSPEQHQVFKITLQLGS